MRLSTLFRIKIDMKRLLLIAWCMVLALTSYAYDFEVDGIKYNILSRENLTVSVAADNNTCSGDIVIPSTVTYGAYTFNVVEISDYFLFNNPNVLSITIQEGVKKIGNCAIFNQSYREIDYISYPNSLDTLVGQAVGGCYNPRKIYIKDIKHWCEDVVLTSPYYSHPLGRGRLDSSGDYYGYLYVDGTLNRNLLIPNNVDHINDGIFHESNIDTLTISSSVKTIGYWAFSESTVKCVNFSIGLDSIASYAFYNTRINDIILPDGLRFVGEYAFYGCKEARNIWINNEILEIEQNAFRGCSSAQKLVLGSGITKIKSDAFADCGQLQQVVSKSLTPPDIEANGFSAGTYLFATLYVPMGTKSIYEAATGWKDFGSINETDDLDDLNTYYTFNVNTTVGGKVSVLDKTLSNTSMSVPVKEGNDITLTFIPDNGYELKSVVINGEEIVGSIEDNSYTISAISQNTSIVVTFAELPVYLTIKSADSGSLSLEIERGKAYSFVITPNEDWIIESVSFNGTDVTSQLDNSKYTTPSITSNSELSIVYKHDVPSTVKANKGDCNVRVSASFGKLIVENSGSSASLNIYTSSGSKVVSKAIGFGITSVDLPTNIIYIVKVGDETFKVSM